MVIVGGLRRFRRWGFKDLSVVIFRVVWAFLGCLGVEPSGSSRVPRLFWGGQGYKVSQPLTL